MLCKVGIDSRLKRRLDLRSNYSYVYPYQTLDNKIIYKVQVGRGNQLYFDEEKEAARYADKVLISKGKQPINILTKKLI
jgi:hypothetical protein